MKRFRHAATVLAKIFGPSINPDVEIQAIQVSLVSGRTIIISPKGIIASVSGDDANLFWEEMDRLDQMDADLVDDEKNTIAPDGSTP